MRNMKGFVFTLDAVFALVVASAATSLLLLALYTPATQLQGPNAESFSIAQNFLQMTMGQAATQVPFALAVVQGWNSGQYTWPQYGNNASLSSATAGFGPQYPFVLFSYQTIPAINPSVAVADGMVVFTANSNLYALNATTGVLVFNTAAATGSSFIGSPIIYAHIIYTANTGANINAYTENGVLLWTTHITGTANNLVLDLENQLLETNMTFLNPFTGNALYATTYYPSAFLDGEYLTVAPFGSTTQLATAYSLYGGSLQQLWTNSIGVTTTSYVSPIAAGGNNAYFSVRTVASPSGTTLFAVSLGSNSVWNTILVGNQVGGAAVIANSVFVKTTSKIYGFTSSGAVLFNSPLPTDTYAATLAATPSTLYMMVNGNVLYAYNEQTGAKLWNLTLQSGLSTLNSVPQSVAIAYGNAYVVVGNTLYAAGTCKADPAASMLQSLATMYLNGQGGCATLLLNRTYGSGKVAMFINNTYAPSMGSIKFSGGNYIEQQNGFAFMNNAVQPFSISIWVRPSASNGVILDELGQQSTGGAWHDSWIELVNGNVDIRVDGASCTSLGSIPLNTWTNIVMTGAVSGSTVAYNGYINGGFANNGIGTRSVPGGSSYMYYPLGVSDSTNCGSGAYYSGEMADYQFYNATLSPGQIGTLYNSGTGGVPAANIVSWWPLEGDTNDYIGDAYAFRYGAPTFTTLASVPPGLQNSYQISKATVPLSIKVNGNYITYNIGVTVWR